MHLSSSNSSQSVLAAHSAVRVHQLRTGHACGPCKYLSCINPNITYLIFRALSLKTVREGDRLHKRSPIHACMFLPYVYICGNTDHRATCMHNSVIGNTTDACVLHEPIVTGFMHFFRNIVYAHLMTTAIYRELR